MKIYFSGFFFVFLGWVSLASSKVSMVLTYEDDPIITAALKKIEEEKPDMVEQFRKLLFSEIEELGKLPIKKEKKVVIVTENQKALIHAEMQHISQSLDDITEAVINEEFERAAKLAKKSGVRKPAKIIATNLDLFFRIPLGMKKRGFALHRELDLYSKFLLKEEITVIEAMRYQVNLKRRNCASCHDRYRLES